MRYLSRVQRAGSISRMPSPRPLRLLKRDEPELSAFRGLLVAASLSALFWGACLTALWLLRLRS